MPLPVLLRISATHQAAFAAGLGLFQLRTQLPFKVNVIGAQTLLQSRHH
jgi:hypothetical protein